MVCVYVLCDRDLNGLCVYNQDLNGLCVCSQDLNGLCVCNQDLNGLRVSCATEALVVCECVLRK